MQTKMFIPEESRELTLFSFGGGQDSWYILLRLIFDKAFRKKYAPNRLLVKMSDTGWEHPKTYMFTARAKKLCEEHEIEFQLITPDMGHHPRTWQTLTTSWEKNNAIGSVTFPQTCTDNIKIQPIDNFVASFLKKEYGLEATNKPSIFKEYYYKYGKLTRIIGFTKDEEGRVKNKDIQAKWKQQVMGFSYPLIELGLNRSDVQAGIRKFGYEVPPPSNCTICFYMSDIELIWLYRNLPDHFWYWVKLERNKKNKTRARGIPNDKNHGPFGKKTIIEKLKAALIKYADWSNERIEEYKMSHGHCVKSKY